MGVICTKFHQGDEPATKRTRLETTANTCPIARTLDSPYETEQNENFQYCTWQNLPCVALVEIYRMLPNKDKFNMSLTCHCWNQPFSRPEVWKNCTFLFKGMDDWRALRFVQPLGSDLSHLIVDFYDYRNLITSATLSNGNLSRFLGGLASRGSNLISMKLINIDLHYQLRQQEARVELVRMLCDILWRQTSSRILNISHAGEYSADAGDVVVSQEQGLPALQQVVNSCWMLVKTLIINETLITTQMIDESLLEKLISAIRLLTNLSEVSLSGENLSSQLLDMLWSVRSPESVNVLRLIAEQLSTVLWTSLGNVCPALKVVYFIVVVIREIFIRNILSPGIPLVRVQLMCQDNLEQQPVVVTTEYLAEQIQCCLEIFIVNIVYFYTRNKLLVDAFVKRCLYLKTLAIKCPGVGPDNSSS